MAKRNRPEEVLEPEPGRERIAATRRRRPPVRGRTFQINKMPKNYIKLLDLLDPVPTWEVERPLLRAQCASMARPCPFVSCRYHRFLDVNEEKKGSQIKLNFPHVLDYTGINEREMAQSCILDLVDDGDRTLDEVGEILNLTRERVRQIEASALKKLRANEATRQLARELMKRRLSLAGEEGAARQGGARKRAVRGCAS